MNGLTLLHPEYAIGLLLVPLLWLVARRLTEGARWRRWSATALQSLALVSLLAALAEPLTLRPGQSLDVVLVLDASDSLSDASRGRAVAYAQAVLADRQPGDRVQLVATAQQARVVTPEQLMAGGWRVAAPVPAGQESDLAAGLHLAGSLLPPQGDRRVLLLSDGWETAGAAADEAARLRATGVEIGVVALPALGSPETIASGLLTPAYVRVGDTVASELHVYSTGPTTATLNLSVDGAIANTRPITLTKGDNLIPLVQTAQAPGFHRLAAAVTAAHDGQPDNNTALATLVVKPPPRVLILEDRSGESAPLVAALTARQIAVDVRAPSTVPAQAAGLAGYDSIILDNVAATSLTLDQQRTLQAAVQRNGRGLVVIGGPTSYARGGYADSVLEDVLPVSSDPKPRPAQGATALILVLDRSGSMSRSEGDVINGLGASKLVMGKEAARQSVDALHDGDSVGVLTFDSDALWTVPVTTIAGPASKEQIKAGITNTPPGGGTDIQGALNTALDAMSKLPARIRHIVLLTDGYEFGTHDYTPLFTGLKAGDISLTTVGIGRGADRALLTQLAKEGGGRFYFTEQTNSIPQIVVKDLDISLKETTVEGPTAARSQAASPLLRDINPAQLPPLGGYDLTGTKPDAVTALVTDDGDPLLAHWQYGLGRVVAFTSGAGPGWAANWTNWSGFPDFWNSVVRWAMANPVDRELQPAITVGASGTAGGLALAHLNVESLQPDSTFTDLASLTAALRAPSGVITTTRLTQTAPGRYEAAVPLSETGAYEVRVLRQVGGAPAQTETAGFTVPINAELLHAGTNDALLRRLTAGQAMLTDPAQALAGRTPQPAGTDGPPLWPYPLGLALVALVAGVAVRRLDFRLRR